MIGRLAAGTIVSLRNHDLDCVVVELLGSGGQGEVYRVSAGDGSVVESLALKWYFPEWSTERQWSDLVWLTEQVPPSASFLWPIDIAVIRTGVRTSSFGYVMPLRPPRYRGCVEILSRRVEISISTSLKACLRLADAFLALHAKGLCYRDISFGNAFIDPASGEVLIADNDNVAVNLEGSLGIHGTDRFMAPEIVRGEALPSAATDLYSLAVLLYYLLMMSHPLEGRRMLQGDVFGPEEAANLYGWDPLFVFDPNDDSNAPDPERHGNAEVFWAMYPQMLRDLFVRAFTDGLSDPVGGRVREGEWRDCMARLLDLQIRCSCGAEVFVEPDGRPVAPCWSCSSPSPSPGHLPMLLLDCAGERQVVALNVGRRLFAHHVRRRSYDYREIVGEVVRHPRTPGLIGIRNLSLDSWTAFIRNGSESNSMEVVVPPGRSIAITPGATIDFGLVRGVVEDHRQ